MPYTILIVEDNPEERSRYKTNFESRGFNIIEAEDGAMGLSVAIEKKPDLIQTGIIMPKMSGFDMVRQLKNNSTTSEIPIIVMSHQGKAEDKTEAQSLGIKDFFVAGFVSPNELNNTILLRIEGNKKIKKYLLDVNMNTPDAQNLVKDFNLSPGLKCDKHLGEKKILELTPDINKIGEFHVRILCPQDAQVI